MELNIEAPKVVRIRRKNGEVVQDCDVYIGRQMTQGGWKLKTSKWYNPFKVTPECDREMAIKKYRKYLLDLLQKEPENWVKPIIKLKGKTLGCWCKPESCHGDVLVEYCVKFNQLCKMSPEERKKQSEIFFEEERKKC